MKEGVFVGRGLFIAVIALAALTLARAQDFQITDVTVDSQGRVMLQHASDPTFYFVLYRGDTVTNIIIARNLTLGQSGQGQLTDSSGVADKVAGFYRVQRVPMAWPMDTDGDGVDDVWELQHGLNPLSALDAQQPSGGAGNPTWKQMYDAELTAGQPVYASFAIAGSSNLVTDATAQIRVRFSRVYNGPLRFQVGGTVLLTNDYEIVGLNSRALSGQVNASGSETMIPVILKDSPTIDRDRTLVLSLMEHPSLTYRLATNAPVTHTLQITEARAALGERSFFASLVPTNNSSIGPQSVRLAIRAGAQEGTEAFFDVAQSTFFPHYFRMAAGIENGQPHFNAPAVGSMQLPGLNRIVTWTLTIENLAANGSNVWTGSYQLDLRGLTAANRPNITAGSITLTAAH